MTDGLVSPDAVEASSPELKEPTLEEIKRQIHVDLLTNALGQLKAAEATQDSNKITEAQDAVDLLMYIANLSYQMNNAKNPNLTVLTEIIEGKLPDGRNIKIAKTSTFVPSEKDSRVRAHRKTDFTDKMKRPGRSDGQTRMQTPEMIEIFTRCEPKLREISVSAQQKYDQQMRDFKTRQITASVRRGNI